MICQACKGTISPDVRFCPKCGAPAVHAQAPPQQPQASWYPSSYGVQSSGRPRVTRNLQTLGILWCVFGAYRIVTGLVGMFFLQAVSMNAFGGQGWPFSHHSPFPQSWMGFLVPVLATVTIASAAMAFITGYSLLSRRPWGRVLGIVAAILALLKFPLGTALGIYTLWVLAPGESGLEYDTVAARS